MCYLDWSSSHGCLIQKLSRSVIRCGHFRASDFISHRKAHITLRINVKPPDPALECLEEYLWPFCVNTLWFIKDYVDHGKTLKQLKSDVHLACRVILAALGKEKCIPEIYFYLKMQKYLLSFWMFWKMSVSPMLFFRITSIVIYRGK